jgi:hypothetical protein
VYPVRHGPDIIMHTIDFATSSTVQWKFPKYDRLGEKEHKRNSHTRYSNRNSVISNKKKAASVLECPYPKIQAVQDKRSSVCCALHTNLNSTERMAIDVMRLNLKIEGY